MKTNKYGVNKNTNNFQTKSTGGEEELIRAKNHQKEDIMGFKDRSVSKFTYQNKASTKSTQATVKKK